MPATLEQATNAIRCLAIDTVNSAGSGHPGAPMGMAPVSAVLFSEVLNFDPTAPQWPNRDRFVLSNGHASALIYSMLHLCGYNLPLDELKRFRQLNSMTPGHPERGVTDGVEVTTGPLGQGIANAIGIAIAEAHLGATFNRPDFPVFNHRTFVFCGDGCLMEGVALEAISLAGHLQLERLIVVYDDNHITIDGNTAIAFTDDTDAKFKAQGWRVLVVEDGDKDFVGIATALKTAQAPCGKPTLIRIRTTIGYLAKLQGTSKVHGAPLGVAEAERIKTTLGRTTTPFTVEPEVYEFFNAAAVRGKKLHAEWNAMLERYKTQHADAAAQLSSFENFQLPKALVDALPRNGDASVATRKASENALAMILPALPQIVGGSADLTASNLTQPASANLTEFQPSNYIGRVIRFGVREHAMAAIINGIDAHGGLIAFGATFLNFIGYALGAVRLSAMSHHGVIYVATHDSIGLGEDGPTHQPVELLQLLRATPNLLAWRPADQTETSAAWLSALENRRTPSVLCLSRHGVPSTPNASIDGARRGAYTVVGRDIKDPAVILISSGTEVSLCVTAANILTGKAVAARVVSMPCQRLFDSQSEEYQRDVLPAGVPVLSVEPYAEYGWERYSHYHLGLTSWGASAPASVLYEHFGLSPANIAATAQSLISYFKDRKLTPSVRIAKL